MDFSEALIKLKEGKHLYRKGWNGIEAGVTMYVFLIKDGEINYWKEMFDIDPFFIFYHGPKKTNNIWTPSMWDIMADDWEVGIPVFESTPIKPDNDIKINIDLDTIHDPESLKSMVDEDLTTKGTLKDLQ